MGKLVKIQDNINRKKKDSEALVRSKNSKIKDLQMDVQRLNGQIKGLTQSIDTINGLYLESAQASVDLLSDLEYHKYKASFVDYSIRHTSSYEKLRQCINAIIKYFLHELKCCSISISYTGVNKKIIEILTKKSSRNHGHMPGFSGEKCNIYNMKLVDILFPERVIGKITVGREPYKDRRKEKAFGMKVKKEILFVKRLLENLISEIHNKELAVKDALTGLYNRKYLDEKLTDNFNSVDLFSGLDAQEHMVLSIIMGKDPKPYSMIRDLFFAESKGKDEFLLQKILLKLSGLNMITKSSDKYLNQLTDHYSFINSKKDYTLYVAMFDLDHFKDVNDNWGGHGMGDMVLINFASIVKTYIRTTDIAVRQGGEEFIIIFSRAMSMTKIWEVLERIRQVCESSLIVKYKGRERNVTVSIGLTQINKLDYNIHQLTSRVDKALYMAKKMRNKIVAVDEDYDGYYKIDM